MKRGQKGFTLVELLIGLAITTTILASLTMTIVMLLTSTPRSNDRSVVLQQVHSASDWISHDVQMARNVTPGGSNGFPLSIDIPVDSDENNDYGVVYLFDGNKLRRELYDSSETLISETLIADYIDTDNTTFSTLDADAGLHKLIIRAVKRQTGAIGGCETSQRLKSS